MLRTAYGLLLRLLPRDFDATDRGEMLDHFEERVRCAREGSGFFAAVDVQLREILDVARSVAWLRWPSALAESFAQDLRTGLGGLRRTPLVTAMAVGSLALGIGATTAVFSVLDVWVIRPLPLPEPDRLLDVALVDPTGSWDETGFSPGEFLDWREAAGSTELAAWHPFTANLVWDGGAKRAEVVESSANFLDVLGLRPSLGRGFEVAEERLGGAQVALVSDAFWRGAMGADPAVLGRSVNLDGEPHTVVGVLPANAHFARIRAEVWIPLRLGDDDSLTVVGRVAPGGSLGAAQRELQGLAERVTAADPEGSSPEVAIQPFRDALYDERYEQLSAVLAASVLFVLLIACSNVSNLLLARGVSRTHEVAVRASLGARRGRIIRQLLTENLVLAVLGGLVGVGVAWLGVEAMVSLVLSSRHIAGLSEISLNLRVLGFSALATFSSLALFGLVPALRGSRVLPAPLLAEGRKTSPSRRRLGDALVVTQIGLAFVLLTSTGVLIASLVRLHRVEMGFRTEDAIRFDLYVPPVSEPDLRKVWQFHQRVLEKVEAIPGAGRATAVFGVPIGPWGTLRYAKAGDVGERPLRSAEYRAVAANYADVMGMRILAGRWFSDEIDVLVATPTVVVSRVLAEAEWGSVDAAPGQRLDLGGPSDNGEVLVVGVVEAGRLRGPQRPAPPVIFRAMTQRPYRGVFHVVEARHDPEAVLDGVVDVVHAMDSTLAVHMPRELEAEVSEQLLPERVILRLLGAMAIVALLLTLVGVYGVVAHTVGQQRHEMGLRLAMGADPGRLIREVLGHSGRIALAGLVGGAAVSLLVGRGLVWALEGVESNDPIILLTVAVLLFTAVLLAAFLPARQLSRVNPAERFRED